MLGASPSACTPCGDGTAKIVRISFTEFLEGGQPSRGPFAVGVWLHVSRIGPPTPGWLPVSTWSSEGGLEGAVLRHCSWTSIMLRGLFLW